MKALSDVAVDVQSHGYLSFKKNTVLSEELT